MFRKFALAMVLQVGIVGHVAAGPNEACADKEGFQVAQQLLKDESSFGKMIVQQTFGKAIAGGLLPSDYTFSAFLSHIEKKGIDGYLDQIIKKALEIDKTISAESLEAVRKQLKNNFMSEQFQASINLYKNYLIFDPQAIAANYDPGLQQVTCSFGYRKNYDLILNYIRTFESHTEQELKIIATNSQIEAATGTKATGYYLVQPNGVGGTAIRMLKGR